MWFCGIVVPMQAAMIFTLWIRVKTPILYLVEHAINWSKVLILCAIKLCPKNRVEIQHAILLTLCSLIFCIKCGAFRYTFGSQNFNKNQLPQNIIKQQINTACQTINVFTYLFINFPCVIPTKLALACNNFICCCKKIKSFF